LLKKVQVPALTGLSARVHVAAVASCLFECGSLVVTAVGAGDQKPAMVSFNQVQVPAPIIWANDGGGGVLHLFSLRGGGRDAPVSTPIGMLKT
jgi:hypothetical protein